MEGRSRAHEAYLVEPGHNDPVTQRIDGIKKLLASPQAMRVGMNLWPPFLGAGIRIEEFAEDWSRVRVRLTKSRLTSNYFGTAYGGSLFSMTDPFFAILTLRRLGPGYVVWDQAGEIEFLAPGRTTVRTTIEIPDEFIVELKEAAASGEKVLRWLECDLTDTSGTVIARVRKQLYVRRKR